MVALHTAEASIDLNQTDQFHELNVESILEYLCSLYKKGPYHHIVRAVSKQYLKD